MADPRRPDREPTEEEIIKALEAEDGEGSLGDELARKWDPERMLSLVAKRAGKSERLDESTRRRYERKLGADLGDVRIYTGEFAEEVTKAHRAEALTIGNTGMVIMGGSPDRSMATTSGRALLAHELTHVAQAQRGIHRKGYGDSAPLATGPNEQEAEAAEAAEYAEAEGGGEEGQDDKDEKVFELVRRRVLDMFEEEERLYLMRNGADSWRP